MSTCMIYFKHLLDRHADELRPDSLLLHHCVVDEWSVASKATSIFKCWLPKAIGICKSQVEDHASA